MRRYRRYKSVGYSHMDVYRKQHDAAVAVSRDSSEIAIVFDGVAVKMAVFMCPSGCGEMLRINLNPASGRKAWRLRVDSDQKVTLSPSIDLDHGCRAHFYLAGNVARVLLD